VAFAFLVLKVMIKGNNHMNGSGPTNGM